MISNASVALGTFPLAGPFSPVTERAASNLIEQFLDAGGTRFDTAPTYADGAVERLLGTQLKHRDRASLSVATSCGFIRTASGYQVSGKRADVIADCQESLSRLGLDYIDVFYSHIPDPNTPFAETMDALRELRREGLIRAIGVSNVTIDQLREYNREGDVSYVQNRFSLLNRAIDDSFFSYCHDNNIKIAAYQVLERGLLTSGLAALNLRDDDLRHRKSEFRADVRSRIAQWSLAYLKPLADERKVDIATLSVWWTLMQPGISLVQCGATRPAQIDAFMAAITLPGDDTLLTSTARAYDDLKKQLQDERKCTVREFMGLEAYDLYKGSPTGR